MVLSVHIAPHCPQWPSASTPMHIIDKKAWSIVPACHTCVRQPCSKQGRPESSRLVCSVSRRHGHSRTGAGKAELLAQLAALHASAGPPAPAAVHYAQRAQKQGWAGHAYDSRAGKQLEKVARDVAAALTASAAKQSWSLGVRDITRLATTTSKLAKACKAKAKMGGPSGALLTQALQVASLQGKA